MSHIEVAVPSTILGFKPDLTEFNRQCRYYYNIAIATAEFTVWQSFCTSNEFVDYCNLVLRFYAHLTLYPLYNAGNLKTESPSKLKNLAELSVPKFILDMCREICRPMYTDQSVDLVAYFPLIHRGIGLVPGVGVLARHRTISMAIKHYSFFNSSIVAEESLGKSPIFVATDKFFAYANGSSCPEFRMKSVNALKFLKPKTTFYLAFNDINTTRAVDVPYVHTPVQILNPDPVLAAPVVNFDDATIPADAGIYDAAGELWNLSRFCAAHQLTVDLTPVVVVGGVNMRPMPAPLVGFQYGGFRPEVIHLIVRALNPIDEELADRQRARARLCIGNGFTFMSYGYFITDHTVFPDKLTPSKPSLDKPMNLNPGKQQRSKPKSDEKPADSKLTEQSSTTTEEKKTTEVKKKPS